MEWTAKWTSAERKKKKNSKNWKKPIRTKTTIDIEPSEWVHSTHSAIYECEREHPGPLQRRKYARVRLHVVLELILNEWIGEWTVPCHPIKIRSLKIWSICLLVGCYTKQSRRFERVLIWRLPLLGVIKTKVKCFSRTTVHCLWWLGFGWPKRVCRDWTKINLIFYFTIYIWCKMCIDISVCDGGVSSRCDFIWEKNVKMKAVASNLSASCVCAHTHTHIQLWWRIQQIFNESELLCLSGTPQSTSAIICVSDISLTNRATRSKSCTFSRYHHTGERFQITMHDLWKIEVHTNNTPSSNGLIHAHTHTEWCSSTPLNANSIFCS